MISILLRMGKVVLCLVIFNANLLLAQQQFSDYKPASYVIGQDDFAGMVEDWNNVIPRNPNGIDISSTGKMAIGTSLVPYGRVVIYNEVPNDFGGAADIVLGKPDFTYDANLDYDQNPGLQVNGSLMKGASDVRFSPDGKKLIVAIPVQNRVLIWNDVDNLVNGQAADVVMGQDDFTTPNFGIASNKMGMPTGIEIAPDGRLIIVESFNNRVLIFNKIPEENGAHADVVIGQTDFNTNVAGETPDKLDYPTDACVGIDGRLYIADTGNDRVLVFDVIPEVNGVAADGVIGQDNFESHIEGTTQHLMNSPTSVSMSPYGQLVVSDWDNNRVLVYESVPDTFSKAQYPLNPDNPDADFVLGQKVFTTAHEYNDGIGAEGNQSAQTNASNMASPDNAYFDLNGRLFVGSQYMPRIMVWGDQPDDEADLVLSMDGEFLSTCTNSVIKYTVTIVNDGPDKAEEVKIISSPPYVLNNVFEPNPSQGTYDQDGDIWEIEVLENGQQATLTFVAQIDQENVGEKVTTFAKIINSSAVDNQPENNAASLEIDNIVPQFAPVTYNLAENYEMDEDQTLVIELFIEDDDTPFGNLQFEVSSSNQELLPNVQMDLDVVQEKVTLTVTPTENLYGESTITFTLKDGVCDNSYESLVQVEPVNDAPSIFGLINGETAEDEYSQWYYFEVEDIDNTFDELSVSIHSNDLNLIANENIIWNDQGNGTYQFKFMGNPDQFGAGILTVTVSDGENVSEGDVNVTITPINDAPYIEVIENEIFTSGFGVVPIPFQVTDIDTSIDAVITSVTSDNEQVIQSNNINVNGIGEDRTISFLNFEFPKYYENVKLTVLADDGELQHERSFRVSFIRLVTGADDQTAQPLQVAPNPVQSVINVKFPSSIDEGSISLHDLKGNELFIRHLDKSSSVEFNMALPGISAGAYLLKIKQGDQIWVHRIMKE